MRLSFQDTLDSTVLLSGLAEHFLDWRGMILRALYSLFATQRGNKSHVSFFSILPTLASFVDVLQIDESWKLLEIGQRNQEKVCLVNCVPVISWGAVGALTEQ